MCTLFQKVEMTHAGTPTVVMVHAIVRLESVCVPKDGKDPTASTKREVSLTPTALSLTD